MKEITFDEIPAVSPPNTIRDAWANLLGDPGLFIRHWNYKGAILSGGLRAPIFFITYLIGRESLKLAVGAALLQFVFRFFFAGLTGALIQEFRRVEPVWKAMVSILLVVPLLSHLLEYFVQWTFVHVTATNDHTDIAIVRSICVSLFSSLFALYIMRRNVLIVGERESRSLLSDIVRLPRLVFDFVAFVPDEIAGMVRRRRAFATLASLAAFGVLSQVIGWAVTNKVFWTYGGGRRIELLRFWGVDGMVLMLIAVGLSLTLRRPLR
ncbi:MAG: hypothetical protein ACK4S4_08550 [Pyrinomonadaceae bacterium]